MALPLGVPDAPRPAGSSAAGSHFVYHFAAWIMGALGQQLRSERESRGLRRVDVSLATEVCVHHLAALEHEDFDELPDDASVESFVRRYAEYLELDPNAAAADLRRELEARRPAPAEPPPAVTIATAPDDEAVEPRSWRPAMRWPLLAAVALLLTLAVWLVPREDRATQPTGAEVGPEAAAAAAGPTAGAAPAPETRAPTTPTVQPPQLRPTSSETTGETASGLEVPEHGVGQAVRNRRLVGVADRFREGGEVWFWTRVEGGAAGQRIRHVWLREGREISRVTLALGGPHWRTHSRKTLFPGSAGRWSVEARDASDALLARRMFTVTE